MFVVSLLHVVEACGICVTFFLCLQQYKGIAKFKDEPIQHKEEKTHA
jgi:hypothetical protein